MALVKPLSKSPYRFLKRVILQRWYRRKTNYPYLSADCFSSAADYYAFGKSGTEPFDTARASAAKSVFVNADLLEKYLEESKRLGKLPRVLLTGLSDRNFDADDLLPEGIDLWLSQNNTSSSNRVRALPIGLENLSWARSGRPKWFEQNTPSSEKINKILVPPMSDTNPIRLPSKLAALAKPEIFEVYDEYLPPKKYFELARKFRFVLCLEGNGYENHRIWETLYLNSFPVMLRTSFSESLNYLNLPILEVESLELVTPEILARFREENENFVAKDAPQLWMPFWEKVMDCGMCITTSRRNK